MTLHTKYFKINLFNYYWILEAISNIIVIIVTAYDLIFKLKL